MDFQNVESVERGAVGKKTNDWFAGICVLICLFGAWAWMDQNEAKKKAAELDAANAQAVAVEQQKQAQEQAEQLRVNSLNLCLADANWQHDEYLKLNGRYNAKTNIITAPVWAFQVAETKRANDISQCHMQYGGNQ